MKQFDDTHKDEKEFLPKQELTLEELSRVTGGVNQPHHHTNNG